LVVKEKGKIIVSMLDRKRRKRRMIKMDLRYDIYLKEIEQQLNLIKKKTKNDGSLIDGVLGYINSIRTEETDDVVILKIAKRSIDEEIMIEFGNGQYAKEMPNAMASCIAEQLSIIYGEEENSEFKGEIQKVIDDLSLN
jgi:hypothetical protein